MGWQVAELVEQHRVEMVQSSPYKPQSNGQVESFNKILKQVLRKTVADHQRDWHERLPEALWSYRTSARVSTGVTLFMLVYGTEAILPLEVELPALRMAIA